MSPSEVMPPDLEIRAGGQVLRFNLFSARVLGALQSFLARLPHPRYMQQVKAVADVLTPELLREMMLDARNRDFNWPPEIAGEDADDAARLIITSEGGFDEIVYQALIRNYPEKTRDDAARIAGEIDYRTAMRIFLVGLNGNVPESIPAESPNGEAIGPKLPMPVAG